MHMLELVTDIVMASSSSSVGMEISEPFRTEDLSKTDFFDFVTGSAPDMAITSSSSSSSGGGGGGGGNSNNNNNSGSCTRVMTGIVSGLGGSAVTDRPPGNGGRNGPGDHSDGSPANRGSSMNSAPSAASNNGPSDGNDQPLQGFDQFWGSDKDVNRLDPAMFEDLNRYCWIQQNNNNNNTSSTNNNNNNNSNNSNNGVLNNQMADTDGQIYTLTVLNGTPEPWVLRKDPTTAEPTAPASNLDLDTILGGFPGYVKTECFSYDDSGFGTDHHAKEDPHQQQQQQHQHQQHLLVQQQHTHAQLQQVQPQQQQQQQQQQQMPVSSSNIVLSSNLLDPNSVLAYQNNNNNNNNDWQMSDHNVIQQETPESLLRSALQGKGYTKGTGMQLQNGGGGAVTVLQSPGHMKDEELRRVLYSTGDPSDSLSAYADSTLTNGMYDDSVLHSPASTNQSLPAALHQEHQQQQHPQQVQMTSGVVQPGQQVVAGDMSTGGGSEGGGQTAASVVVDDMFLTLDAAFTEDYEKLKRIETEVQQFCSDNNNYTEIIVETGPIGTLPPSANSNHVNSTGNLLITASTTTSTGPNQHHPHHPGAGSAATMVLSPAPVGSVGLNARQPTVSTTTSSDVVTTTSPTKAKAPRAKKSYKRSLSSNANSNAGSNQAGSTGTGNAPMLSSPTSTNLTCLATSNNNNNSSSMNNLNALGGGGMLSPTGGAGSSTSISSGTTTTITTSPTQCGNGGGTGVGGAGQQRKERSLHYCSICSKGFKDKYSVNVHIRTHTGEKPFACSLCGKSFRQKAHLAKHYQTHLAQKNPGGGGGTGGGGGGGGGTVSKQSKQSRLAAPPPTDPSVASGQLTSPVSGPTAAPPPSLPNDLVSSLTVVQSGSPPMLLNSATATVSQIVASR